MTTPINPHVQQHIPANQAVWRCIYIAKAGDGQMLGLILAPSHAVASAYFLGSGLPVHSIEVIDPCRGDQGDPSTGVCVVATAVKRRIEGRNGPDTLFVLER